MTNLSLLGHRFTWALV